MVLRSLPLCVFMGTALFWAALSVQADVAPPVKIHTPHNTPLAKQGQESAGIFELHIERTGVVDDIRVQGSGWVIESVDHPALPYSAAAGVLRIEFRATPSDPEEPIELTLTFDGQRLNRVVRLGPIARAESGKDRPAVSEGGSRVGPSVGTPSDDGVKAIAQTAGGAILVGFKGRIVYDRPVMVDSDGNGTGGVVPLGVDHISVRVLDNDDVGSETLWQGLTDTNGYFDSGALAWDDCDDFGCDEPDLILEFATNASIVFVGDDDFPPNIYTWSTPEVPDFPGGTYDFGTVRPAFPTDMPALHIFNGIIRTHRFIESRTGLDTPKVGVVWPEPSEGTAPAFYQDSTETIHLRPRAQWSELAQSHEYGHHFMHRFSNTIAPDYCNGFCDDLDCTAGDGNCDSPSHCDGCPENAHDAWNEGWPDWLGDVVTRSYREEYTMDDGSPYLPISGADRDTLPECCQDDVLYDDRPFEVEGFVTALLRDIEDDSFDDHNEADVYRDMLCLGVDEIFDVVVNANPVTLELFIIGFLALHPEHAAGLKMTAMNVSPLFGPLFPEGVPGDIGLVEEFQSPTHPLGVGGPLPCVVAAWTPPLDDADGICGHHYKWTASPTPDEPSFNNRPVGSIGCQLTASGVFNQVGDYYFNIKEEECGYFPLEWATLGPFTVTDCNNSGVVDLCDISCGHSGYEGCSLVPNPICEGPNCTAFCNVPGCGTSSDCQPNLVPDECDVAAGTSEDCNENGIPDECEDISHWGTGGGIWHDPVSWEEQSTPQDNYHVCIEQSPEDVVVTYTNGFLQLASLHCDESLKLESLTTAAPAAQLAIDAPGYIQGVLQLRPRFNGVRLTTNETFGVYGPFLWNGGTLDGPGEINMQGGMSITATGSLIGKRLNSFGTTVSTQRILVSGGAIINNKYGAEWDHQADTDVVAQTGGIFFNEGLFRKSGGGGSTVFGCYVDNRGEMRIESGTLVFWDGSSSAGTVIGWPGTTLEMNCGGHTFGFPSSVEADRVVFSGGNCGESYISGRYNVATSTTQASGSPITFNNGATIISYGANLEITGGAPVIFDAVVGSTVHFDSIIGGTARFNSGDPIVAETLTLQNNGVISGPSPITVNTMLTWKAGTIFRGPGVVNSYGELIVAAGGAQKTLENRTLNINGLAVFNGQFALSQAAAVNNLTAGVMDIRVDGNIMTGSTPLFNNAGTVVKTVGAGTSTIFPETTNTGILESRIGTLEFRRLTQTAGEIFLNGGDFGMYQITTPQPLQLAGGLLRGNGTVIGVVNHTGGAVSPGLSAGELTVNGTYNQDTGGTLRIEIGGRTPSVEFDQLNVTGTATVVGALEVEFINDFVPSPDDTFLILTALVRNGLFTRLDHEGLPSYLGLTFTPSPTSIRVDIFERPPPEGDCNHSESIDLSDFIVLHGCLSGPLGPNPPPIASQCRCIDMDLDDDIDLQDFALFQIAMSP